MRILLSLAIVLSLFLTVGCTAFETAKQVNNASAKVYKRVRKVGSKILKVADKAYEVNKDLLTVSQDKALKRYRASVIDLDKAAIEVYEASLEGIPALEVIMTPNL